MVQHDVLEIARVLVDGMKHFLATAIPDATAEHIRATSPRDWSLLARAWTESMEECYAEIWTPRINEAWARIMTLLLRSIFKVLWYKEADDLNQQLERKASSDPSQKSSSKVSSSKKKIVKGAQSCRNLAAATKPKTKKHIVEWAIESCPDLEVTTSHTTPTAKITHAKRQKKKAGVVVSKKIDRHAESCRNLTDTKV